MCFKGKGGSGNKKDGKRCGRCNRKSGDCEKTKLTQTKEQAGDRKERCNLRLR